MNSVFGNMSIELIPVNENFQITDINSLEVKSVVEDTLNYYKTIGFVEPWISYLAKQEDRFIGICSFKGKPVNNKVEIAYFTFPLYEGNGYAKEMCGKLIDIALKKDKNITIIAHTLPEENASTNILTKNNFVFIGQINDKDDGDIFEWELQGSIVQ
jgi:RimJ/RimL family protein N-acetyltransferase